MALDKSIRNTPTLWPIFSFVFQVSIQVLRAESRGFSEKLLNKLKIYFEYSYLIASKWISQKFLKNLIDYTGQ